MSCGGPGEEGGERTGPDCGPRVDLGGATAARAGEVNGEPAGEYGGRTVEQADGIRLVVLSACALGLLLFMYIFLRYVKQQRSRGAQRRQQQDSEGLSLVELPPKKVMMYEAMSDDGSSLCSDCPVVVVNGWSFTGSDRGGVAVGWPEPRGQSSQTGSGEESSGAAAL